MTCFYNFRINILIIEISPCLLAQCLNMLIYLVLVDVDVMCLRDDPRVLHDPGVLDQGIL